MKKFILFALVIVLSMGVVSKGQTQSNQTQFFVQRCFFSSGDGSGWQFGLQYLMREDRRIFPSCEFNAAFGTSGYYGEQNDDSPNYTFITKEGYYPFNDFVPGEPFDQGILNLKGRTGRDFYANLEFGAGVKLLDINHHVISVQAALGIGYIDRSYIAMEVDGIFSSVFIEDTPVRLIVPYYYSFVALEHTYKVKYQYVTNGGFVIGVCGAWHQYFKGAGRVYCGGVILGKRF